MLSVQQPFMGISAMENQDQSEAMFFAENRTTLSGQMAAELPMSNKQSAMASPLSYTSTNLPTGSPSSYSNPEYSVYQNEIYTPTMAQSEIVNNNEMWNPTLQQAPQQNPYFYPSSPYNQPYPYDRYGMTDMSNSSHRKNATRESTNTLKAWLQEHKKNPYPTKGEKIMLAIISKMTLTQVSTWFANARRRLKKENKMTWVPKNRSNEAGSEKKDDEDDDEVFLQSTNKEQISQSPCSITPSSLPNTPPNNQQKIWSPLNDSRSPIYHSAPMNNTNQPPKPSIFSNTFPTLQSSIANNTTAFRFPNNSSFYNEQSTCSSESTNITHTESFTPNSNTQVAFGKYQSHSNQRVSPYTIPSPCQNQYPARETQMYSPPQCNISPNAPQPCYETRPDQAIFPQQAVLSDDFNSQYYSSCSRESSPQDTSSVVSNPTTLSPWNCGQVNELNNRTLSELSVH